LSKQRSNLLQDGSACVEATPHDVRVRCRYRDGLAFE